MTLFASVSAIVAGANVRVENLAAIEAVFALLKAATVFRLITGAVSRLPARGTTIFSSAASVKNVVATYSSTYL